MPKRFGFCANVALSKMKCIMIFGVQVGGFLTIENVVIQIDGDISFYIVGLVTRERTGIKCEWYRSRESW